MPSETVEGAAFLEFARERLAALFPENPQNPSNDGFNIANAAKRLAHITGGDAAVERRYLQKLFDGQRPSPKRRAALANLINVKPSQLPEWPHVPKAIAKLREARAALEANEPRASVVEKIGRDLDELGY